MQPIRSSRIVRRLDVSEVDEASRVLARAFQDDPLQIYVFPDAAERERLSPAHFLPLVRYGHLTGGVWTTTQPLDAVAIWWPPEHREVQADKLAEAGFFELPCTIGEEPFRRFNQVLDYIQLFHEQDMPEPHWYATVIGVDRNAQGCGVGSRLIEPVLSRADQDSVPCYLETCQPANVAFYNKHGFDVVRHGTEPASGLAYWTFRRNPR